MRPELGQASTRRKGTLAARKAEWLRKRLAAMEEELEEMANSKRLAKYAKDSGKLARAEDAASKAKWIGRGLSTVKYGFFAWDMVKVREGCERRIFMMPDMSLSVGSALRDALSDRVLVLSGMNSK